MATYLIYITLKIEQVIKHILNKTQSYNLLNAFLLFCLDAPILHSIIRGLTKGAPYMVKEHYES